MPLLNAATAIIWDPSADDAMPVQALPPSDKTAVHDTPLSVLL